ncbi:autotransporter-associated N-terminal domain-containing protein, partial [Fusobacterium animalis]|uniref:autotransporter-associated N-terminal domain-containing protein n=1 Tax=Fusobacterium animalis TaxID=76859 RepID=UPI0034DE2BAB
MSNEQIAESKENLKGSIGNLQSKIDNARAENEKDLKGLRLELIQLMEQGDQVIKSPWSSWQFGANYIYNDWRGTYRGRGDKSEKYPYEGVYTRSSSVYERSISTTSKQYSSLATAKDRTSASSNNRNGMKSGYGLIKVGQVEEPIVGFDVSAGVRPKQVSKGTITIADKNPITPEKPEAIRFNTPTISITPPASVSVTAAAPTVTAPTVTAPSPNVPTLPVALSFSPVTPTITAPTAPTISLSTPPTITFQAGGFGQDRQAMIHGTQGIHLMNFAEYTATGTATFDVANNSSKLSSGSVSYDPKNLASLSLPPGVPVHSTIPAGTITAGDTTPYFMNAVFSHVVPMNVTMTGNYVLNSTATHNILFISVNPYDYYETPGNKKFSFQGNVTLNSTGGSSVVGMEHQLLNGDGGGGHTPVNQVVSTVENSGTITLGNGQNMIGMMLDTEYYGLPANYKFSQPPQTNNNGKIVVSSSAKNSVGFDYGYYVPTASGVGPNGTVKVGNIEVNGNSNYAYRQKYYTPVYYDDMGTVDGSNGTVTLNGSNNIGYSIAQGKSTGDPISNITNMQVTVDGKNNVGFLRNSDTKSTNTNAITLNAAKLGSTFNFGSNATGGALIRSDVHEVILDKDITVGATGKQNSLMQAGHDGKVTLASGKKITSTSADEFYGMTAGNFAGADGKKAIATNNGELDIGGNKSLGMAIDVDDEGINNGKINFSGTLGAGVYNTGTFTSKSGSEINISGQSSIGAFNSKTLTIDNGAKIQGTAKDTTGIYGTDGTATNNGTITMTAASVKGLVTGGANANIVNNKTVTVTGKGAVGAASLEGTITAAAGSITADGISGISLYTGGTVGGTINATGGTVEAKNGAINVFADKGTINFKGATIETKASSLTFMKGNGTVNFVNPTNANIATNGTVFYIPPAISPVPTSPSYTGFTGLTASDLAAFNNLSNLTLNMSKNSNIAVASYVQATVTDLGGPGASITGLGFNILGTDYNNYLLYKS